MTAAPGEPRVDGWPGADGVVFVRGYDEVRAALGDSRLVIHMPLAGEAAATPKAGQRSRRIAPLSAVLSEHLAARAVASLAAEVRVITDEFARTLQREGRAEAIDGLASPLPMTIMARLLGLRKAPAGMLRPLFDHITAGHDFGASTVDQQQARMALRMLTAWLDRELEAAAGPSTLMAAIQAAAELNGLDRATVLYWCAMLLYAGSTTTRDFIGNILAALLDRQDIVQTLLREPDSMDLAMEELLRVEGPVRGLMRRATEDLSLGGQFVHQGQLVCLLLAEANRDPARFAAPHCWDLHRSPNPHLALGANVTYCLGSHLARMEARGVLAGLLPVLAQLRSEGDAIWTQSRLLRGRARLTLRWQG